MTYGISVNQEEGISTEIYTTMHCLITTELIVTTVKCSNRNCTQIEYIAECTQGPCYFVDNWREN